MAFYHKYRPQNFNDIKLTQAKVAETLVLSLLKKQLGHAYLFTGTHGTGKTTTARIVAKAVNCARFGKLPEYTGKKSEDIFKECIVPCDECDACKNITSGSFLDVIEMDAASNRGIDEIRELKDKIRLAPMHANKKVYIIDEVHMLTTEAFNALLKTLEEPPAHSLFILCTTELHKVPQTIQSRCTKIIFQMPGLAEITSLLAYIVKAEKLKADEAALLSLAKASGGAFRDAVKLLEMVSVQTNEITADAVSLMTHGSARIDSLLIITLLRTGNTKELLSQVKVLVQHGTHFNELLKTLLADARDLLFYKAGVSQVSEVSCLSGVSSQELQSYNAILDMGFLSEYIEGLVKALGQQKSTPIPSLPLELVFLKLSGVVMQSAPVTISSATTASPTIPQTKTTIKIEKSEIASVDNVVLVSDEVIEVQETPVLPSSTIATVTDQELTIDLMQERWPEVCKLLKKYHASMSIMMSKCKPIRLDGKSVIIETQNSFNKDMIESSKNRPVIEQAIYELLGAQVRVKTVLANTKLTQKNVENVQSVSDDDLVSVAQELFGM
ncbi:MAG: DNA polymerase III subunit gamma/tau [bacterium]|nr:DNA polymerase III subunit gamma/tau [bacterium]